MLMAGADLAPLALTNRLLAPALDLRQGRYARTPRRDLEFLAQARLDRRDRRRRAYADRALRIR
jgi:hypothetical protein